MARSANRHETLDINRGCLRTARKRHECVGAGGYDPETGWSPVNHPIEIGEQYLEMRMVWPAIKEIVEAPYPFNLPLPPGPFIDGDVFDLQPLPPDSFIDGDVFDLQGDLPAHGEGNPWQEACPMGSIPFRMCLECAIEDGYATPICR